MNLVLFDRNVARRFHNISAAGTHLFAPHRDGNEVAPWQLTASDVGPQLDLNGSLYAAFGEDRINTTVEADVIITADYDLGVVGSWGATAYRHAGIGLRYTSSADFTVLAMISVAGDEFQVVDKVGGLETIHHRGVIAGGLSYNTKYRIRIELSGTVAICTLYDAAGTQLDTHTINPTNPGAPATGYSTIHVYAAVAQFPRVYEYSGATILMESSVPFSSVAIILHKNGLFVSAGTLDLYCDGTNASPNSWLCLLSTLKSVNFRLTGTLIRKSGRCQGISFRCDGDGDGYHVYWDDNGTGSVILRKDKINTSTVVGSYLNQGHLTIDTEYPFTLDVVGPAVIWTINGTVYSFSDSSYPASGYVGLLGYQAHLQFKELRFVYL